MLLIKCLKQVEQHILHSQLISELPSSVPSSFHYVLISAGIYIMLNTVGGGGEARWGKKFKQRFRRINEKEEGKTEENYINKTGIIIRRGKNNLNGGG